jgi:hypothetical protein
MISPEVIDVFIYVVIAIGLVWAGIRLYQDLSRPLPDESNELSEKELAEIRKQAEIEAKRLTRKERNK